MASAGISGQRCASPELATPLLRAFMLFEARENNRIERANPSRAMAERLDLVRRLSRYEGRLREFFGIGLRIEPATAPDVLEAVRIQQALPVWAACEQSLNKNGKAPVGPRHVTWERVLL